MTALDLYDDGTNSLTNPPRRLRYPVRKHLSDELVSPWSRSVLATSVFSAHRNPTWFESTINRMRELVNLEIGWDGHNGRPVDTDIAMFAIQVLLQTLNSDGRMPQIVPISYGGIQLEWHEQGIDLEIEIESPDRLFVSYEDHITGENFEREFSTDYSEVTRVMGILASRATVNK